MVSENKDLILNKKKKKQKKKKKKNEIKESKQSIFMVRKIDFFVIKFCKL